MHTYQIHLGKLFSCRSLCVYMQYAMSRILDAYETLFCSGNYGIEFDGILRAALRERMENAICRLGNCAKCRHSFVNKLFGRKVIYSPYEVACRKLMTLTLLTQSH